MLLNCSLFLAVNVPSMGMVLIQMFIHILQLWLEVTLQLRPLHLECGRQQTVLYGEWIRMQVYILDLSGQGIISKLIKLVNIDLTCSNDLSPLCLPQFSISFMISSFTFLLLHSTDNVPRTLFSMAHCFSTSTSGTTTAIMQLWKRNEILWSDREHLGNFKLTEEVTKKLRNKTR